MRNKIQEEWNKIWQKMKIKNQKEVDVFLKQDNKEFMANNQGFVISCKAGDFKR